MGEVEIGIEGLGDPLALGEFLPVVGRQRVNTSRKRRQQDNDDV